jgi:hypothetical protein
LLGLIKDRKGDKTDMAKERLHELKQTGNSFQLRGVVTGTKSQRFYKSGTGKNGGSWNVVEFGVKIGENKTVFVKLNGFPRDEVFYYKRGENGAKGTTQKVKWKDRKKAPGKDYRLIGVNISTGKDADGKNVNETFVEYDAVEWIHENLSDGDSVFIKGNLEFSSYTDRNGQTRKKADMIPTQISYTQKSIDFDADDYKEMAEFENTIVFQSIDKEMDENDKPTERYVLSGYAIGYNTVEHVSFIIDKDHAKLANNLRKAMKPGYSIKTYGKVVIINDISVVENDDDGWGEASPMERINSPVRREYIVYKADPNSIEKEDYTEADIERAIKKIKAAKEASANFGDKPSSAANDDVDDWGADDDDSGEEPW